MSLNPIVRRWREFWFSPIDPLPLAVFRIALGLLLVAMFACLYVPWKRYFDPSGILSMTDQTLPAYADEWWSIFYWTRGILSTQCIWWIAMISAVGFTAGWKTRVWTVLLFIIQMSTIHRNRWVANGEDLVFRMLLFYSCFATLDQVGSLSHWLRSRKPGFRELTPSEYPSAWPIRLMQINITLVYIISLPNKLVDDVAWRNGHAIYLSIVSNLWSRFPWPSLFYNGILSAFFTYGTICVEGLFPILVWFRKTRLYALAAIASLHLGIAIILKNVTFFSLSMIASFGVFLPGEILRAWAAKVRSIHPSWLTGGKHGSGDTRN